jgi:Baseplate J-like protein
VEDWRARVVDEWQTVTTLGARGGRAADYVYWARAAHPSVTGALVQAHTLGMGTVVVRPICNGLADRLPTQAVLDAVLAKLLATAPLVAEFYVLQPVLRPVAVTLDLAAAADTAGNRAAIAAAISVVALAEQSAGATLLLSELDAAVATVTTQYVRVAPVADLICAAGEVFAPPVVTWA